MVSSVSVDVTINPRDLARVTKSLDKWRGKPLALFLSRVSRAALSLMLRPVKARAARHNRTGLTQRGYLVRKLPQHSGEVSAWKVDSNTAWRAYAVAGTRYITADPYVDQVYQALEPQIRSFVDEQVRTLA